eukprot:Skav204782  [mRNA]  locus=scaffold763:180996:181361:+ [translate_table: standard]
MADPLGVPNRSLVEVGGPVALVLRSKLQELAKTSSAQRAAQRWQDVVTAGNRSVAEVQVCSAGAVRSKLKRHSEHDLQVDFFGSFQELGNAKVLMPENSIPWGVTHFIGPERPERRAKRRA